MRLSIFILFAALFISCQNTGNGEGEHIQIGNWDINTDNGISVLTEDQSISDYNIVLSRHHEDEAFYLIYIDSTINKSTFPDLEEEELFIDTPFKDSTFTKRITEWTHNYIRAEVTIPFSCDCTYETNNEIIKTGVINKKERFFNAIGMIKTANYIVGCN